jgi:ADP-ribose pyrophosphatase YjhB (NUDIX family)
MKEYKCISEEEKKFLENYDASKYERPSLTTDIVIFTLDNDDDLNILLIKRGAFPYKNKWAIPGGFLNVGTESLEEAAARELKEETNVDNVFLNQLYTFSNPKRDPRTTVISVAYTALVPKNKLDIKAGDDAAAAALFKIKYDVNGIIFSNDKATVSEEDLADDGASNQYVAKVRELAEKEGNGVFVISAKLEEELSELSDEEKAEFLKDLGVESSGLDKLIAASYKLLGLISFLTAGEDECRAWTIKEGTKAPQAAGKIHTDFERGFIKAEVVNYKDLLELGSLSAAKEKGIVGMEGKEYVVKDGDVILFRFNV